MDTLEQQLTTLPAKPGVYIYKDTAGNVLYVGKAKKLRSRVQSYFRPAAELEPAKQQMVKLVTSLETITTDTEVEALILEANLIRKHQPPYNVVLRDDKYYLFIKITTREEYPRVFLVRRVKRDGARYFGPYSSAQAVRSTLRLLRRLFPFKSEKDAPRDVIFPHPLFTNKLQATSYKLNIENIIRFLSGERQEIIRVLRAGMEQASRDQHFERAATFRDQLQAIERLEGTQKVFLASKESFDVVSLARAATRSAANIFQVRGGKLLGKQTFLLKHRSQTPAADTLRQFMLQYYSVAQDVPKIIFIPEALSDQAALAQWINQASPPALQVPRRGQKRQLLTMGEQNAQQLLTAEEANFANQAYAKQAQAELFEALKLNVKPHSAKAPLASSAGHPQRVETYDISNIQGTLPTASMVVFEDGAAKPAQYRKFRLKPLGQPNDFAMLQETLSRRFSGRHEDWAAPDLIIIDGGKGQLSAALKILTQLKVSAPVISLAKREEEIFLPNQPHSLRLPVDSPALFLLQRMRDEAHRFTISYHRLLRSKRSVRSLLDDIPGIGPKTKKQLLQRFGSIKNIRTTPREEIEKLLGRKKTEILENYLTFS